MLLLLLPLLLTALKIAVIASQTARLKQNIREECFSAALLGLRSGEEIAAAREFVEKFPDFEIKVTDDPHSESEKGKGMEHQLVFNLKNETMNINCGAYAKWKNEEWDYEIVLDKF